MLDGQLIAGSSVSFTVTVKLQLPGFPAVSVAEHVTVAVPTANVDPDAGAHVTAGAVSQLSVAVTGA